MSWVKYQTYIKVRAEERVSDKRWRNIGIGIGIAGLVLAALSIGIV